MYLKKVEIQGFKSFADKTEIEFRNEVTAIVGPNGCGKSNISDAIRWVLGEQSIKNLRGSKMEDVIFSGTDKRRALGYAEVTINFDNKSGRIPIDYNEVAVTRRMFRSGESEYYLNKNSCRLKDIRELFMDTGIGKDGYSIIGQGKIDEILSNKPEDRRNIFEEAAGIVKFKTKKEEATRKLDRTEINITRIKDLIFEVASQKEVLEIEAEKATQFKKVYTKLRDLEVNLFIKDIKKLGKQIEDINIEKDKIGSELIIIEDEKFLIEEQYNVLKTNIQLIEKIIEDSRTIKFDAIQIFEKNKNQVSMLVDKENYMNKDVERLRKEKLELQVTLENLEDSKKGLNSDLDIIDTKLILLKEEFECKKLELETLDQALIKEEVYLEEGKNSIIEHYNLLSDKKSEINSINSFNENIDKRILLLKNEIKDANCYIDELTIKYNNLLIDESSLKSVYESETKLHNKLNTDKLDLEKNYNHINENIKSNQIKLNGLNSSFNLYKNMEAGYEGYYKSVKGILQGTKNNKNLSKGLIGVVADLLKVEEKYEKAIDISLGANVQNIVVESEENAKVLVSYLKEHRLGRATFLPINVIKGKTIKLDMSDNEEFNILGLGHELISYDKKYNNIFEYLLGRTIIVRDIDSGIKLAKKYNHIYRIVTLEGEVLNTGGSITGGSYGKDSINIINRKNKIESLGLEIKSTNEEILSLEQIKKTLEESLHALEIEITRSKSSLKLIDIKILENSNVQISKRYDIERFNNEIHKKQSEITILTKEFEDFKVNKEKLRISVVEMERKIDLIKDSNNTKTGIIMELKSNKNKLDKAVTNNRININLMESSKSSIIDKTINYQSSKEQLNALILDKNNIIASIYKELEAIELNKIQLNEEISFHISKEDEITLDLNNNIKKKDSYMKTFYDEQDRLRIINKKISEIDKVNNNLEIRLTRYELQYENNHIKLQDDYELNFEEAMKYEKDIVNISVAQSEVKVLKEEIKTLGNINLSAIEEFKNVTERLDFITTQHSDLISAKENLKEIIKDMEKKMKSQFMKSFEEINENFTEVFSVLFNGGKARLELEDYEDILNTGIEIKVQSPGKKPQSLSLLSGGEKSLTAVALLFAILKTKPAPFCILDEIDAALDEANINRYTNYLKSFDIMTQFVLITHRKTTMEIADVLYGVTMEEEGVSKLISVELKNNLVEAS